MAKTYDPKDILISWGNITFQGYASGSIVTVSRNSDSFTLAVGSDGEAARSKSNDRSGRVVVNLMQTSLTNTLLSQQQLIDELTGNAVKPFLMKDIRGTSLYQAEAMWIVKPPDGSYAQEIESREWTFETGNLYMRTGGSPFPVISAT
jgi:hypothetical protein